MTAKSSERNKKEDNNSASNSSSEAFGRGITAIYGLNLALSYENASADRLQERLSKCSVIELRKALERHLKQTREQQNRLRKRIEILAGYAAGAAPGKSDNALLARSHVDTLKPTNEKGRLPIPEPPASLKAIMESVGTDSEREVMESVNDLIIEKAEAVLYRAGIDALKLLQADKKTIDILKKNLKEEEGFAKWLEKNSPRIAKKLMTEQMQKGKKARREVKEEQEQEATAMPQ
jgi:ferritin-like metal-binding protein YciE